MLDTVKIYTSISDSSHIQPIETIIKENKGYSNVKELLAMRDPYIYIVQNRESRRLYIVGTIGAALSGSNSYLPKSVAEVIEGIETMRSEAETVSGLTLPDIREWRLSRVDLSTEWAVEGNPDSIILAVHRSLNRTRSQELKLISDKEGASLSLGNRRSQFYRLYDKSRQLKQVAGQNMTELTRQLRFEASYSGYALKKRFKSGSTVETLLHFLEKEWHEAMQFEWNAVIGQTTTFSEVDLHAKLKQYRGAKQLQIFETLCAVTLVGVEAYKASTDASPDTIRRRLRSLEKAGLGKCYDIECIPEYMRVLSYPLCSNSDSP